MARALDVADADHGVAAGRRRGQSRRRRRLRAERPAPGNARAHAGLFDRGRLLAGASRSDPRALCPVPTGSAGRGPLGRPAPLGAVLARASRRRRTSVAGSSSPRPGQLPVSQMAGDAMARATSTRNRTDSGHAPSAARHLAARADPPHHRANIRQPICCPRRWQGCPGSGCRCRPLYRRPSSIHTPAAGEACTRRIGVTPVPAGGGGRHRRWPGDT